MHSIHQDQSTSLVVSDEFLVLSFDGADAAKGRMDAREVVTALAGWDTFLRTGAASYLRGKPELPDGEFGKKIRVSVTAIQPGSLEFWLDVALTGIVSGVAYDLVRPHLGGAASSLRNYLKGLYQSHLESKRDRLDQEWAAERLRHAATYGAEVKPVTERDTEVALRFAAVIDGSLEEATHPLDSDATVVDLRLLDGTPVLHAGPEERALLLERYSGPMQPRPSGQIEKRKIKLLQVNVHNGWGRFEFEEPRDPTEQRQQECKIKDPYLKRPNDEYSLALSRRTPIDVYLSMVVREESRTRSHYWIVYGPEAIPEDMLFAS